MVTMEMEMKEMERRLTEERARRREGEMKAALREKLLEERLARERAETKAAQDLKDVRAQIDLIKLQAEFKERAFVVHKAVFEGLDMLLFWRHLSWSSVQESLKLCRGLVSLRGHLIARRDQH